MPLTGPRLIASVQVQILEWDGELRAVAKGGLDLDVVGAVTTVPRAQVRADVRAAVAYLIDTGVGLVARKAIDMAEQEAEGGQRNLDTGSEVPGP